MARYPLSCSVVVPVYNSEHTLAELVSRLKRVLTELCPAYEIILVNDGSRDGSWVRIQELVKQNKGVVGISMMRNYGQHNALLCGVRAARCDLVVTMDDDLQHPPEEIDKLLARLNEGYDVVYGLPKTLPHTFLRNLSSRLTKRLLAFVMGIPTVRDIGSFRAFRTRLRKAFETYQSSSLILDVLLAWGTTNFGSVVVDENPRQAGRSNYSFGMLFAQAMLILVGYSTMPLRVASMMGFVFTLFGLAIFLYVVVLYFTSGSIPGFPFLASIISIFSGMQLFALGIFGEYLARMYDRSMDRPTYVVSENIGQ